LRGFGGGTALGFLGEGEEAEREKEEDDGGLARGPRAARRALSARAAHVRGREGRLGQERPGWAGTRPRRGGGGGGLDRAAGPRQAGRKEGGGKPPGRERGGKGAGPRGEEAQEKEGEKERERKRGRKGRLRAGLGPKEEERLFLGFSF
jgi:hypothetical protein